MLLIGLTAFAWLTCVQAIAQTGSSEMETRFQQAVLDSAIRYEYLKPITTALKLENAQLHKENLQLRITTELYEKKSAYELKLHTEQYQALKKQGNSKLLTGFGLGTLLTLIIIKL